MRAACFHAGLFDLFETHPAVLEVAFARFGERQAPRGAVQQTRLEMVFKLRNQPRHLCRRGVGLLRGSGKAAGIDDPDKGLHRI